MLLSVHKLVLETAEVAEASEEAVTLPETKTRRSLIELQRAVGALELAHEACRGTAVELKGAVEEAGGIGVEERAAGLAVVAAAEGSATGVRAELE